MTLSSPLPKSNPSLSTMADVMMQLQANPELARFLQTGRPSTGSQANNTTPEEIEVIDISSDEEEDHPHEDIIAKYCDVEVVDFSGMSGYDEVNDYAMPEEQDNTEAPEAALPANNNVSIKPEPMDDSLLSRLVPSRRSAQVASTSIQQGYLRDAQIDSLIKKSLASSSKGLTKSQLPNVDVPPKTKSVCKRQSVLKSKTGTVHPNQHIAQRNRTVTQLQSTPTSTVTSTTIETPLISNGTPSRGKCTIFVLLELANWFS